MYLMLTYFPKLSLPISHCSWAGSQPAIDQEDNIRTLLVNCRLGASLQLTRRVLMLSSLLFVSWSTPGLC